MAEALLSQSLGGPRKKKTVLVVKKIERKSPKKEVFVSRKMKDGEDVEESFMGNLSSQRPVQAKDSGEYLSRSILGDPKTFSMFEEHIGSGDVVPSLPATRSQGSKKTILCRPGSESGKRDKQGKKVEMVTDSENYVESLKRLKSNAMKLRVKEREKEQNLIQYLPVNERFDLNKEGKVLAMWQERQRKWDHIQKKLSNKVGVTESNLLMSTGDEYRTRAEEYDLLQAAIPVHERFGTDSWEMQLRGGTEKAVTIGHVFSGLTCNVSFKRPTPTTLRKPKKMKGTKTSTFTESRSMKLRQKQFKKTLQTLRPHNITPPDADSLIICSRDLYDWAISTSQEYINELQCNVEDESEDVSINTMGLDETSTHVELKPESVGPQLSFISSRTLLFTALQGETSKAHVVFANTGTTAMQYTWKKVSMHMDSEVWQTCKSRTNQPREHALSESRPVFFCSCPVGQVLPGEQIETTFLFTSRGSGGYFSEGWMLDTSPRAVVNYPNRLGRSSSFKEGDGRLSTAPVPSAVYVKLKGHAATLDEYQHRRDSSLGALREGRICQDMGDEVYDVVRTIRKPITLEEFNQRKLEAFKLLNADFFSSNFDVFHDESSSIYMTSPRLEAFLRLAREVHDFAALLSDLEGSRIKEAGLSIEPTTEICTNGSEQQEHLRGLLLPESRVLCFDEITEDMLEFSWDFKVDALAEEIQRLIRSAGNIEESEKVIERNRLEEMKKKIKEEKRAADSDYESDEDDEEDEEDEEDSSQSTPEHELVIKSKHFDNQLRKLVISLGIAVQPSLDAPLKSALVRTLDKFEDMRSGTLAEVDPKGKFEPPPIPNAFSEEGIAFWDELLNVSSDNSEASKRQKSGQEKDPKKRFYLEMYEKVFSSIVDELSSELVQVDEGLESSLPETENVFSDVGALRKEDIESLPSSSSVVFLSCDADCFTAKPRKSAVKLTAHEQRRTVAPIVQSASYGARRVVLLHETKDATQVDSIKNVSTQIQDLLKVEDSKEAIKLKRKEGKVCDYVVYPCPSIPHLTHLLQEPPPNEGVVHVYFVDNLASDNIVPQRPEYEYEDSDDDEAPVPIGLSEYRNKKLTEWKLSGPQKVSVEVTCGKKISNVECFSDVSFALQDLFSSFSGMWIEAGSLSLFGSQKLSNVTEKRILSADLRHMILYILIMQKMATKVHNVDITRSSIEDQVLEKDIDSVGLDSRTLTSSFDMFYYNLFGQSSVSSPRFAATIGGKLTPQKLKVIERLIDYAHTIMICGEICLPFIACQSNIQFSRYLRICSDFSSMCGLILEKVKLRGIEFVLPEDLVCGDEILSETQLEQCCINYDESALDEGTDYDGESSVVSLESGCIVSGPVYDIGPSSCDMFSANIKRSQLHFSWGTAGCSEMSSFQAGQRAIVSASSPATLSDDSIPISSYKYDSSPRNIVVGSSNVEWWTRICDPEGENEGRLVEMGVADLVCLNSETISSILCNTHSGPLSNVVRRTPSHCEWDYLTELRKEEEEEEEDDDDDENESDDE